MKRLAPSLSWALALLGAAALAGPEPHPGERVRVVLTRVQGSISVDEAGATRGGAVRRASHLQILRFGDVLHVPPEAAVVLICSTDHRIELVSPSRWRISEEACRQGKRLRKGTFQEVEPGLGRIRNVTGVLALERESQRSWEDEAFYPIFFSPRQSDLLQARPALVWSRVPDAIEYEVKLVGEAPFTWTFPVEELRCGKDLLGWEGLDVCHASYPTRAPSLIPGELAFLEVGAKTGLASPLRKSMELNRIRLLTADRAEQVRERVREIEELTEADATRKFLLAGVYFENGLLSDAWVTCREGLALKPLPQAQITLGDIALRMNLDRHAYQAYHSALSNEGAAEVRAAAELGLGRVLYRRGNFEEAAGHFSRAQDSFRRIGAVPEYRAAEIAWKMALLGGVRR